jgi:dimethylargininase
METKKALVRRPSPHLADAIVTNIGRGPVDYHLAAKQWDGYVEALQDADWEIVEVSPADGCPDGVFVEDAVVVFRNVAVITRPRADSRRPETVGAEAAVEGLGCSINRIHQPGTIDGGDVLKVGDTVYVGSGGRTNAEGLRQLRSIIEPLGAQIIAVPAPVHRAPHLKSAVDALPDGTIIGYLPLIEDPGFFPHFVAVPEASGANIVHLGGSKILMSADCPRSTDLLAAMGYEPVTVDISEFQKLEGSVTCLSVRLRALSAFGP